MKVSFTDDADNEEILTSEATVEVAAAPNRDATGAPTISGTPQVRETLTADTADIADEDGLTNVAYRYQWIAGGSDINGATSSTYTLTASEQGKTIKVKVSFTDDADNQESLTSADTDTVAATKPGVPGHLNAFPHDAGALDVYWEAPASDGGYELSGPIPPELGDMDSLEIMWLGGNKLSGSIPPQLGSLFNLTQLHLRTNELSGSIPAKLKDLTNLRRLWVHQNQLSGSIPSELGDLASLEILNLRANMLSGTVPSDLGKLSKLKDLLLHDNRLEGAIPDELGDLASLRRLWLSQNQLTGSIPASLGNLPLLTSLNLHTNRLSGEIPSQLGEVGDTLTHWRLSGNQLTGCIPVGLAAVGNSDFDQLGLPTCEVPTPRFTAISSGSNHTCALRDDSSPVCWGSDEHGQASPPKSEHFTAISSGTYHSCGAP